MVPGQWTSAVAESFFNLLKRERIRRRTYKTRDDARSDIFDYIEFFYTQNANTLKTACCRPSNLKDSKIGTGKASKKPGAIQSLQQSLDHSFVAFLPESWRDQQFHDPQLNRKCYPRPRLDCRGHDRKRATIRKHPPLALKEDWPTAGTRLAPCATPIRSAKR